MKRRAASRGYGQELPIIEKEQAVVPVFGKATSNGIPIFEFLPRSVDGPISAEKVQEELISRFPLFWSK